MPVLPGTFNLVAPQYSRAAESVEPKAPHVSTRVAGVCELGGSTENEGGGHESFGDRGTRRADVVDACGGWDAARKAGGLQIREREKTPEGGQDAAPVRGDGDTRGDGHGRRRRGRA